MSSAEKLTIGSLDGTVKSSSSVIAIVIVIFMLILAVSVGLGLYMANRSKQSEREKKLYSRSAEIGILAGGAVAIFLLIILGIFLIMVLPSSTKAKEIENLAENTTFSSNQKLKVL